tara:strand:- start:254 stop:457 length:204 start_codon:yes stop_codon:yes gene_type:complete
MNNNSLLKIINENIVLIINCIDNILQHPTKHSPNPDISYILPNKHCGNIKPIDNEHKLLKQPHILSK